MIYIFLFVFIFFESLIWIWYFFPGSLFLVLSVSYVHNFFLLALIALSANILGSTLNYFLWYFAGKKVLTKWYLFLKKDYFKKGIEFAHKYKGRFILIWKLVPGIKEIITFIAWVFHIPFKKFIFWNFLGALIWFIIYFLLGYIFWFSSYFLIHYFWKLWQLFGFIFVLLLFFGLLNLFLTYFWKKMYIFVKQTFYYFKNKYFPNLKINLSFVIWLIVAFIAISLLFDYFWFVKLFYNLPLIHNTDISISNMMVYFYDPYLLKLALLVSYFWSFIWIFLLASLFLCFEKNKIWRLRLILGIFSVTFLVLLTKYIVARHRPEMSVYIEYFYSFPSAHASLSMFFYLFLAFYLAGKSKYWNEKINWLIFFSFVIFLIGLSRLYLNVHYFSDIVGWYWIWFVLFVLVMLIPKSKYEYKFNVSCFFILFLVFLLFLGYYINKPLKIYKFKPEKTYIDNIDKFLYNDKYKYVTTIFGRKTEPINFIFLVFTGNDLINLFKKAGFVSTDKVNIKSIKTLTQSAYAGLKYPNAPMLPLIWNNLVQTYNFQEQENNLLFRHHIRIWNTHIKYWSYNIFVWSAVFDNWLKWKITHKISPDLDKEREYFFSRLVKTGLITKWKKIQLVRPFTWYNFSYDKFYTDWKAYILWVK